MSTIVRGEFEWDSDKAAENARKHHVTFQEAATAFNDPRQILVQDTVHDERFVLIGMSDRVRILYVVHAEVEIDRRGKNRFRLISARVANMREVKKYALGDST